MSKRLLHASDSKDDGIQGRDEEDYLCRSMLLGSENIRQIEIPKFTMLCNLANQKKLMR